MIAESFVAASVFVGFAVQLTFVLIYITRRWWILPVGRALMAQSAALLVLVADGVAAVFFSIPAVVDALVYWLVVSTLIWQLVVLVRQPKFKDQKKHVIYDNEEDPVNN